MWLDKFSARVFSWNREGQYLLFYLLTVCCFMFPIEYLHIGLKYSTISICVSFFHRESLWAIRFRLLRRLWPMLFYCRCLFSFLRTGGGSCLFRFSCSTFFCLIQTLYARVYEDIMPYSSFLLVNNVNDVLLNSVRD